ncbi:LuxR C-terminal-related transcriptional regulator [Actinomadura kijaniata]|uniref:LuxR C-terminal-related transcriptional regulator n=1 Tax=Actinomadura kijaniata TaxID=46161 RepID=UPI003F1D4B55
MGPPVDPVDHALAPAAQADTAAGFGVELARRLGRWIPHDGFQMIILDPLSRVGCLYAQRDCYSNQANHALKIPQNMTGSSGTPFGRLLGGRPVEVLGAGLPDPSPDEPVREVMAAEGFGSELRVALTSGDQVWGAMSLLRERGSRPFGDEHAEAVERARQAVVRATRRFVTGQPLRPADAGTAVGTLVVDRDFTVTAMTDSCHGLLHALSCDTAAINAPLSARVLRSVVFAARRTGGPVVDTVPTARGWVALHGQPLPGDRPDQVVLTVQPASGAALLRAAACWYGLTRREQTVIQLTLEGLSVKQIAHRLGLSPHTVNDHFKAVRRKTDVSGRDELLARLTA